jgi:hypothetical protein
MNDRDEIQRRQAALNNERNHLIVKMERQQNEINRRLHILSVDRRAFDVEGRQLSTIVTDLERVTAEIQTLNQALKQLIDEGA